METPYYFLITNFGLTERQRQIAELIVKGCTNREAANVLFVTEKTVKFHLTNIFKKVNVASRAQLIVFCKDYKHGATEPSVVTHATQIVGSDPLPAGR